jgi:hypothetical protein
VRRALAALFLLLLPLLTPRIRGADEIEYFAYLRSLAFDRDLDFGNEYRHFYERDPESLAAFKGTFLDQREALTGRHINFAPLGSAVLWAPFYALAHAGVVVARALGSELPADGFSWPYVAAVGFGSALLGFGGLLLAHDASRRHFPEPASGLAVAGVWLATPVLYYTTLAPAYSHAPSLFVVSLLLWCSLRRAAARDAGGAGEWACLGALGGLAALVREQDGLFLAVPALWLAWQTGQARDWRGGAGRALALLAAAALVFVPQLLAYRALNGRFGPSTLVARKMSYSSPHFLEVLFDPGHGLFLWSPILLLATAGLLAARRRAPQATALLTLALLLQVWINGSVASWSQAGAFGARRFVSATFVFAWGLAALLAALQPRLGGRALAAGVALFAWWNVSLMVQFGLKLMDRQRLEWPKVAVQQFSEVPPRLARTAWLFVTDRERLVRESR